MPQIKAVGADIRFSGADIPDKGGDDIDDVKIDVGDFDQDGEFASGCKGQFQRACYLCGKGTLGRFPSIGGYVREKAPEGIRHSRHGVESTCCLILLMQALLIGIWAWAFATAIEGNINTRFLSIEGESFDVNGSPLCTAVKVSINDEFSLDNNGFWNTNSKWAFAETMLGVRTRGFESTTELWIAEGAPTLANQFRQWNTDLQNLGSSAAITAMVASDVSLEMPEAKKGAFHAQIKADPIMLMKADYFWNLGLSDNENKSIIKLNYADSEGDGVISATYEDFTAAFPEWKFNEQDEYDDFFADVPKSDVAVRFNKYSLYIASAVNMGLLSIADLISLEDSGLGDDDGAGDDDLVVFDDDTFINQDDDFQDDYTFLDDYNYYYNYNNDFDDDLIPAVTPAPQAAPSAATPAPQPAPSADGGRRLLPLAETHDRINHNKPLSAGPIQREKTEVTDRLLASRGLISTPQVFTTPLQALKPYVAWKFYEEMDPILCSIEKGRCFLRVGGSPMNPKYGATLFPIIQNYDENCLKCGGANSNACNNLDIEYMFFFDAHKPGTPTWFDYSRTDFKHYDQKDSGMSGALLVNLYYGVQYLTSGFYKLPRIHCAKPLTITSSAGGTLSCGSAKAEKALKKGKGKAKFCNSLPVKPQEIFFECKMALSEIVLASLGAAYGGMGTAAGFLTIGLMLIATHVLGLRPPKPVEEPAEAEWNRRKSAHSAGGESGSGGGEAAKKGGGEVELAQVRTGAASATGQTGWTSGDVEVPAPQSLPS